MIPLTLQPGEQMLGHWQVNYVPPSGGRYPGLLWVTDRRVFFACDVDLRHLQARVVGPVNALAVAYVFDLDPSHVAYETNCLRLSIPKADIECVTPDCMLLSNCVDLTLKNNGSIQQFERRLLPVDDIIRATQSDHG
jgi:hypothetical protein